MRRRNMLSSTSLPILGAALLTAICTPSYAADTATEADQFEDAREITVTARRVTENLQDVPATVQVFTAATLTSASVRTTEDFIALTPGVSIVSGAAEPGDPQINIRGVNGVRDAEPSVALMVDGILKTSVTALNQTQGDVTQIEVLKGPQGALYGRNATSGAFILTTRKPGDHLEGRFKAAYREAETAEFFGSLSGPLAEGLGLLVSADYYRTRGQYQIVSPTSSNGKYMDPRREWNVNGRLVIDPTDTLSLDLKAHYGKQKSGSIIYNAVFSLPAFASPASPLFDEEINSHKFDFITNVVPRSWVRTKEASLKADYDLGGAQLTGWVSYSDIDRDMYSDGTSASFGFFNTAPLCRSSTAALFESGYALPAPTFIGATPEASLFPPYSPTTCDGTIYQRRLQRDISGEIRISGDLGDSLKWLGGVYYLDLKRQVAVNLGQDTGNGVIREPFTNDPRNPTEQLAWDAFKTRAYALFGSVDWKPLDSVTLSGALRYDNERRRSHSLVPLDARTQYVDFDGPPYTGGAPLNPGLLTGPIPDAAKTFTQVEPKFSVTWEPSRDLTVYANYGKGFKSGGFNNSGSGAIIDVAFNSTLGANLTITDIYRKETSDAFEGGFKASLFGGRLRLDGAGYYTAVHDLQFFEFFVGSFGVLRVVSNIDRVDMWGGELSATLKLTEGWTVFGSGNFTKSKIKENAARPDTVGNKSPYTPDYTLNVGTQADFPLNDTVTLTGRVDARITGPTWFSTVQDQTRPTIFGAPGDYSKSERASYTTVNLRVGLKAGGWEAAFVASNLFNEKYLEEILPAPEFGGSFVAPSQRRRLGAEILYRF